MGGTPLHRWILQDLALQMFASYYVDSFFLFLLRNSNHSSLFLIPNERSLPLNIVLNSILEGRIQPGPFSERARWCLRGGQEDLHAVVEKEAGRGPLGLTEGRGGMVELLWADLE